MSIPIGSQWYTWFQYYQAQGRNPDDHLEETLARISDAGLDAFEPSIGSAADIDRLAPLCRHCRLKIPSIYVGARLHEENWMIGAAAVLARASAAAGMLGTSVVVLNPDPIQWGVADNKNDDALRRQASALVYLTTELRRLNMDLAYHTHDVEMRQAARELHHSLLATREVGMKFCLDLHWIYRGSGNSNVALLDIIELYGRRVAGLHLRQSHGGVWSELLEEGDVDYPQALRRLLQLGFSGPAILEICAESGTPRSMSPVEAHRKSAAWFRTLLDSSGPRLQHGCGAGE